MPRPSQVFPFRFDLNDAGDNTSWILKVVGVAAIEVAPSSHVDAFYVEHAAIGTKVLVSVGNGLILGGISGDLKITPVYTQPEVGMLFRLDAMVHYCVPGAWMAKRSPLVVNAVADPTGAAYIDILELPGYGRTHGRIHLRNLGTAANYRLHRFLGAREVIDTAVAIAEDTTVGITVDPTTFEYMQLKVNTAGGNFQASANLRDA